MTSCKKELTEQVNTSGSSSGGASRAADCTENITKVCHDHILRFTSQAHFQQTYDCLEAEYEAHYQAVLDQYGYMSDEDFNSQLDNMGFDEDQPLIAFETTLGFSSWRAEHRAIEDAWLANGADLNNDPTGHNVVDDPVLEAMLSQEGMVAIGGELKWINPAGEWVYISPWNCEDAGALVNGTYAGEINQYFKHYESVCATCMEAKHDNNNHQDCGSNRKVKWRHQHSYNPNSSDNGIYAVQKCYRKKFGIFWGRWRTLQTIDLWGEFHPDYQDPTCPRAAYHATRSARNWRMQLYEPIPSTWPPIYCLPDCAPNAAFTVCSTVNVQLCI